MPSERSQQNKAKWGPRRDAWFAAHPNCSTCGGTEGLRIVWNGPGPKPYKSMLEAFRVKEPRRSELLAHCVPICHACWLLTRKRNEHGGGVTGVSGCKCDLCRPLQLASARKWSRKQTQVWDQRRAWALEQGLPVPRRVQNKNNNTWNMSPAGVEHKRTQRHTARDTYMAGKTCAICGGDYMLQVTWKEYPGPLRSSGDIWGLGAARRAEYLEKCHILCISCLRLRSQGRRRSHER